MVWMVLEGRMDIRKLHFPPAAVINLGWDWWIVGYRDVDVGGGSQG